MSTSSSTALSSAEHLSAWLTAIVAVAGLSVAMSCMLVVPVDIYRVSHLGEEAGTQANNGELCFVLSETTCGFSSHAWFSVIGSLGILNLYIGSYLTACLSIVVVFVDFLCFLILLPAGYMIMVIFAFVVIPFAYFFYEESEPDTTTGRRMCVALKYTTMTC